MEKSFYLFVELESQKIHFFFSKESFEENEPEKDGDLVKVTCDGPFEGGFVCYTFELESYYNKYGIFKMTISQTWDRAALLFLNALKFDHESEKHV